MSARAAAVAVGALLAACSPRDEPAARARPEASQRAAQPVPVPAPLDASAAPPSLPPLPSAAAVTPSSAAPPPPASPLPSAMLSYLAAKPYVEDRCDDAPLPGLPGAKRCRYSVLGLDAEVTMLSPSAERVSRWIVDAARYAAPFSALEGTDAAAWERALLAFARHVRHQSSRIFPLSGEIVEDLGGGATAYRFDRGVVTPCDKGRCRCRINSLTPRAFCRYEEQQGRSYEDCVARYDGPKGDEAWRAQCLKNLERSLELDDNPHFRAKALVVGRAVEKRCGGACAPAQIVTHLEKELGVSR